MKRLSALILSAILATGIASISESTFAQQRVTKDQLSGTWTLVSCANADGSTPVFCVNANGRMMVEANGRYMWSIAARGRPKCTGECGRAQMTGDQYKAAVLGFASNFGSSTFNEADQTVTANIEAAMFPNTEGIQTKGNVSLTGDELRIQYITDGGGAGPTHIWRRAR